VLRSDNLSAATHDLRRSRGRALNRRYRELSATLHEIHSP
jgi:hypothetical protein